MNHLFELVIRLPAEARELRLFQIALISTETYPTQPFNAGIKSLRATLPAEIFYRDFNF
jgi:hypothetical protein